MKPISISAAKQIANSFDYDQIIIIGRKINQGEHVTTYGINQTHCEIAAKIGDFLKYKIMKWSQLIETDSDEEAYKFLYQEKIDEMQLLLETIRTIYAIAGENPDIADLCNERLEDSRFESL